MKRVIEAFCKVRDDDAGLFAGGDVCCSVFEQDFALGDKLRDAVPVYFEPVLWVVFFGADGGEELGVERALFVFGDFFPFYV